MRQYSVTFTEPVKRVLIETKLNKETHQYERKEYVEESRYFTFYTLSEAKKFIKENIDKYQESMITQIWSNGDWENLGPIKLTGNNKHFVANTKQRKASY